MFGHRVQFSSQFKLNKLIRYSPSYSLAFLLHQGDVKHEAKPKTQAKAGLDRNTQGVGRYGEWAVFATTVNS
jgi:hypothetical protein